MHVRRHPMHVWWSHVAHVGRGHAVEAAMHVGGHGWHVGGHAAHLGMVGGE